MKQIKSEEKDFKAGNNFRPLYFQRWIHNISDQHILGLLREYREAPQRVTSRIWNGIGLGKEAEESVGSR